MQSKMVDLLKVMVLGGHPIHWDKTVVGMVLIELSGQVYGVDDLVQEIQWPGEQVQLMAGGHRKGIGIGQGIQVSLGGLAGLESLVLCPQGIHEYSAVG